MVKRSCERFYMAKVLLTITQKCFKSSIVENMVLEMEEKGPLHVHHSDLNSSS